MIAVKVIQFLKQNSLTIIICLAVLGALYLNHTRSSRVSAEIQKTLSEQNNKVLEIQRQTSERLDEIDQKYSARIEEIQMQKQNQVKQLSAKPPVELADELRKRITSK